MFDNIGSFFRKIMKTEPKQLTSKDAAKERLHLVLMQDRANVSADFLELMKQEIINVIKKYIDIDEKAIDVRLTNQANDDGTNGAPALYANIPIVNIKSDMKVDSEESNTVEENKEEKQEEKKVEEEKKEEKVEEIKKEIKAEDKEIENDSKKEDEDDIDVPTFDELLKQSEEEIKKEETKKQEEKKEEKKSTKTNNTNTKKNKTN